MLLVNTVRLEALARLIARGYPPVLAASAAGYRDLRVSRGATRLAPRPAMGEAKARRGAAAADKETGSAGDAQSAPPPPPLPLPPMLTEEEWLAKYATVLHRESPARP
jgi:hypothetical protein